MIPEIASSAITIVKYFKSFVVAEVKRDEIIEKTEKNSEEIKHEVEELKESIKELKELLKEGRRSPLRSEEKGTRKIFKEDIDVSRLLGVYDKNG
jgi:predicted translin family RNA/ssDNA-binding protein